MSYIVDVIIQTKTMLIFFLHGVAESNVRFADSLKHLLKNEFSSRGQELPHFHSGFYADVLNNKDKIWNYIHQDLENNKRENPHVNNQEIFRGQDLRQDFISHFVGDALTYLNPERGAKIRETIADHLEDFIKKYPRDKELHFIAHSMGTVVLFDILFSEQFKSEDAAFKIRSLIKENTQLKSITTMGSPILLFNMLLDISSEHVHKIVCNYNQECLRWVNIIHSSDLIAYPIKSSLKINSDSNLIITDKFVQQKANNIENSIRAISEFPVVGNAIEITPGIKQALSWAALAAGAADAHTGYWECSQTANIIADNIFNTEESIINRVIARLQKVPGMTTNLGEIINPIAENIPGVKKQWNNLLGSFDKLVENFKFADNSGKLRMRDNVAQIPHVTIYDKNGDCKFRGYVGLIHSAGLREEVKAIKQKYSHRNLLILNPVKRTQ